MKFGLAVLKGIVAVAIIWLGLISAFFPGLQLLWMIQQQAASLAGVVIPQVCPDGQCLQTNRYVLRVGDERDAVVPTLAADAWYSGTCAFDTAEIPLVHEVFLFGSRHKNWVVPIMVDSKRVNDTRVVHAFNHISPGTDNFRLLGFCWRGAGWASQFTSPEVGLLGLGLLLMTLQPFAVWRLNRSLSPAISMLLMYAILFVGSILVGCGLLVLNIYLFFISLIGPIVVLLGALLLFLLSRLPILLVRQLRCNRQTARP